MRSTAQICVADPHRVGHESKYYPGDVNFRMADAIVVNKANTATDENISKWVCPVCIFPPAGVLRLLVCIFA